MPYYAITYQEGAQPPRKQLIHAPDDETADKIAAEVCQAGRYNGNVKRTIKLVERV